MVFKITYSTYKDNNIKACVGGGEPLYVEEIMEMWRKQVMKILLQTPE